MTDIYAGVRHKKYTLEKLRDEAEAHGRNRDKVPHVIQGTEYSSYACVIGDDHKFKPRLIRPDETKDAPELKLVDAFKRHKKFHGASERKNAAPVVELIAYVSPGYFKEADAIDYQAMLKAAVRWANQEYGEYSAFAARIDFDEEGSSMDMPAAVSVFIAPVREYSVGRGKPKKWIAPRKAEGEIADRHGLPHYRSYSAAQDTWCEAVSCKAGYMFQRGKPKSITKKRHLKHGEFRWTMEKLKAEVERLQELANEKTEKYQKLRDDLRDKAPDWLMQKLGIMIEDRGR